MDEKSLIKLTNKYQCMVSGEKRMTPCSGCTNIKGCVSKGMQYKEKDKMNEKAIVKIDAEGQVVKCAKGLDADECGFKVGAKVCGACGAMPIVGKTQIDSMENEEMEDDEYMMSSSKGMGMRPKPTPMYDEEMMDEEDEEDEEMTDDESESESDDDEMMKRRMKARTRRLESMGMKSADLDDDAFICGFDRKVYPGASSVCDNCPGGCAREGSLPTLLEIEGIAEDMLNGKVLDSGYSDEADFFVVDVERKDGITVEMFFDGSTGECWGWQRLSEQTSEKSAFEAVPAIINFEEAAAIAVKSIEGQVTGVDPDVFEGFDSYAVEIEGIDGKSYDVYVSLDGEVLGYDEYESDEAAEIEAEAAEIALKRAYSEDERNAMVKKGQALPDGSYPIKDEEDLRNAIQAYGRAKDKNAAKAHIMKRALDLNLEDLIPMNWVPKKIQEEVAGGKKDASDEFLATLMEFEILAAEEQARDVLGGNL